MEKARFTLTMVRFGMKALGLMIKCMELANPTSFIIETELSCMKVHINLGKNMDKGNYFTKMEK